MNNDESRRLGSDLVISFLCKVGKPEQKFSVVFDTGSGILASRELTWFGLSSLVITGYHWSSLVITGHPKLVWTFQDSPTFHLVPSGSGSDFGPGHVILPSSEPLASVAGFTMFHAEVTSLVSGVTAKPASFTIVTTDRRSAMAQMFQAFLDLVYVGKVNQFSGIAIQMKLESGTELIWILQELSALWYSSFREENAKFRRPPMEPSTSTTMVLLCDQVQQWNITDDMNFISDFINSINSASWNVKSKSWIFLSVNLRYDNHW